MPAIYADTSALQFRSETCAALTTAATTDPGRALLLPLLAAALECAGTADDRYGLGGVCIEAHDPAGARGARALLVHGTNGNALVTIRIDGDACARLGDTPTGAAWLPRGSAETYIKSKGFAPLGARHAGDGAPEWPDVRQVVPDYADGREVAGRISFRSDVFELPGKVGRRLGFVCFNGKRRISGGSWVVRMGGALAPVLVEATETHVNATGGPIRVLVVVMPYRLD